MAGFLDQFGGLKLGQSKTVGSFTGTQELPGVQVIRGSGSAAGDIDAWLMRGYALKDAVSAVTGATAADKVKVDTNLAPAESLARNNQANAIANVQNTTAKLMPAESTARIAGINADVGLTNVQAAVARRRGLDTTELAPTNLQSVMGTSPMFRLSDIIAAR